VIPKPTGSGLAPSLAERAKPPDPDLFLAAAEKLGVDIGASIVVGDSVWDLLAARRARALAVGVLSGGYGPDERGCLSCLPGSLRFVEASRRALRSTNRLILNKRRREFRHVCKLLTVLFGWLLTNSLRNHSVRNLVVCRLRNNFPFHQINLLGVRPASDNFVRIFHADSW
jgi:hypothetical protein